MKLPLSAAERDTSEQLRRRSPPPLASDSSSKPLAVRLEANQTAAISVTLPPQSGAHMEMVKKKKKKVPGTLFEVSFFYRCSFKYK